MEILQLKNDELASISEYEYIIRIWDLNKGNCIKKLILEGNSSFITTIALQRQNKNALISCSLDGSVKTWDLINGDCVSIKNIDNTVWSCIFI